MNNPSEQKATPGLTDDGKCEAMLRKISQKVDGQPVLYATEYNRPDAQRKSTTTAALAKAAMEAALKAASATLQSGLPNSGWIVVIPAGIAVFTRATLGGGPGTHKGTIPTKLIHKVSVKHDKKPGKANIFVVFADNSEATLRTKTKITYPALSPWIQGMAVPAVAEAPPAFDHQALFADSPGINH